MMRIHSRSLIINRFFEIMEDTRPPYIEGKSDFLLGHIHASATQLLSQLGLPTHKGNGKETRVEWHVATPAGFATIYDWKETQKLTENSVWCVGGTSYSVIEYIEQALNVLVMKGAL